MGLKEQISAAANPEALDVLLKEGDSYVWASPRTRSAWFHAANRKRVEFGMATEARKQERKVEKQEPKTPKHKKHGQK